MIQGSFWDESEDCDFSCPWDESEDCDFSCPFDVHRFISHV